MAHVISPEQNKKKKEKKRQTLLQDKNWLAKTMVFLSLGFIKREWLSFYFPLALFLGRVPLKAGRCKRNSIWLFALHHGQGTRRGVSKVQVQKAKTTVRGGGGSDCAFTNYSVPLESGPASGAYRGSLL